MVISPIVDPYSIHYDSFVGDVYTIDTASITLTAGTLTASTITDGTATLTGGALDSCTIGGTTPAAGTFTDIAGTNLTIDHIAEKTASHDIVIDDFVIVSSGKSVTVNNATAGKGFSNYAGAGFQLTLYNEGAAGANPRINRARGTESSPDYLNDNDIISAFNYRPWDDGFPKNDAMFSVKALGNHSSGKRGTQMTIDLTAQDTTTRAEVIRFEGGGNAYLAANMHALRYVMGLDLDTYIGPGIANHLIFKTGGTTQIDIGTTSMYILPPLWMRSKIFFTQTDENEFIDSLADGYMDYGATTAHRFNSNVDITGTIRTTADQDWNLGAASAQADFAGDTKIRVTIGGTDYDIVALAA